MKANDCSDIIDTNLKGTINCCLGVIRYMVRRNSGKIINISSITGIYTFVGTTVYTSSKSAIITFSKCLGLELAKYNINISCLVPGLVKTDILKQIPDSFITEYQNLVGHINILNHEDIAKEVLILSLQKDKLCNLAPIII